MINVPCAVPCRPGRNFYRCSRICECAAYPNRPIRVISPYPAGSASDTVTRVVLDQVSQLIGRPMVIELKPGAGGATGFATVARSDPDGYTLVTSSSSMATETVLHSNAGV